MPRDDGIEKPGEHASRSKSAVGLPREGELFKPREVFGGFGVGAFIPERIARSRALSMTAKVCYGHLLRRAGKNDSCWPSYRDIAENTGLQERQTMRGIKELINAQLIRRGVRTVETGRQTSNKYVFIWGPILQGEGDTSDTLLPVVSDQGTLTSTTPSGVSEMTPLEVKKINHHQGRDSKGSSARAESTVRGSAAIEAERAAPQRADDDEPRRVEYASGKDELKAIYFAKTGEQFRIADLDAIEASLVAAGVTWEAFAADVRAHSWDRIKNPVGFLKNRAKNFRAITRRSTAPVTAAEAAVQNYRCPICSSRTPGEGARIVSGRWEPCTCAGPEYIQRQRARGVFAPKADA